MNATRTPPSLLPSRPRRAGPARRRTDRPRYLVVLGALLAAAFALALGLAAPAGAHTTLLSSDPTDGATLQAPPSAITLNFDEPVQASTLQLAVTDSGGATVSKQPPTVTGSTVVQALPSSLPGGTYTLSYRLVSVDGHPVSNSISFTVQGGSTTSSAAGQSALSSAPAAAPSGTGSDSKSTGSPAWERVLGAAVILGIVVLIVAAGRRFLNRGRGPRGRL